MAPNLRCELASVVQHAKPTLLSKFTPLPTSFETLHEAENVLLAMATAVLRGIFPAEAKVEAGSRLLAYLGQLRGVAMGERGGKEKPLSLTARREMATHTLAALY